MRPAFLDLMFRPNNESNKEENVTVRSALETTAWDDVTVTTGSVLSRVPGKLLLLSSSFPGRWCYGLNGCVP